MVDGVYQDIAEALKPGVKESQIVALATKRLYEMGSDCVEADQLHRRRTLQPASAQLHGSADSARRPGVLRHHSLVHWISNLLLPDVHRRQFHAGPARCVQEGPPVDGRRHRHAEARTQHRQGGKAAAQGFRYRFRERNGCVRSELLSRTRTGPARAAADLATELVCRNLTN